MICEERFPRISIPFFRWEPHDLHCKFVVMEAVNHLRVMQYQFHEDGSSEGTQVTEASEDIHPAGSKAGILRNHVVCICTFQILECLLSCPPELHKISHNNRINKLAVHKRPNQKLHLPSVHAMAGAPVVPVDHVHCSLPAAQCALHLSRPGSPSSGEAPQCRVGGEDPHLQDQRSQVSQEAAGHLGQDHGEPDLQQGSRLGGVHRFDGHEEEGMATTGGYMG